MAVDDYGRVETARQRADAGYDRAGAREAEPTLAASRARSEVGTTPRSRGRGGFVSFAYAALRVTAGTILLAHGTLKLMDFAGWAETVRSLQLYGVSLPVPTILATLSLTAEFAGGLALILGLLTRLAALGVFVNMLMAILTVHAGHGLLAQHGGFEYPLLMLMSSALFLAAGSGELGLDARMRRARSARREARRQRRAEMGPRYAH